MLLARLCLITQDNNSGSSQNLNETSLKIVLVADDEGLLKGTVCDGDIRRGLLGEENLDSELFKIMKTDPLVAPESWDRSSILQLMNANKVQQVPIVDAENKLVGLHLWDKVNTPLIRENTVVIMAGGKGKIEASYIRKAKANGRGCRKADAGTHN